MCSFSNHNEEYKLLTMSVPSICLSYTRFTTQKSFVQEVFNTIFKSDCVDNIDEVLREKEVKGKTQKYKMYFIHFKEDVDVDEDALTTFKDAFEANEAKQVFYQGEEGPFWWATKARPKVEHKVAPVVK